MISHWVQREKYVTHCESLSTFVTCIRTSCHGAVCCRDERRRQHVLNHRALWQQAMVLKNETDLLVAKGGELLSVEYERILTVELDLSARWRFERAEQVK